MSNSTLRVLTAIVGVPAILGLLYVGSWPFAILVLLLSLLAQYEVYELLAEAGLAPQKPVGLVLGALLVIHPLYELAVPIAIAVAILVIAGFTFSGRPTDVGSESKTGTANAAAKAGSQAGSLAATFFGAIYPSALLSFLVSLRMARGPEVDEVGAFLLALSVFLFVWSTDTFAYYVGRAMGKRPLAPTVSPKKTWEGAVGGTLGALLVGVLLKLIALDFLAWGHVIAIALICAIIGQLGDLAESKIKRIVGVKDSGTLLPGHGGLLDRFDAMILAAPAVYLYLEFGARIFA